MRHAPGRWLALAIAIMVLAAGCSGSTSERGNAGGTAETIPPPSRGGNLVVGVSAEPEGFLPTSNQWSGPAVQIARAVFDPLVVMDRDGRWQPYLAKSLTPNADFTQWTIDLRPGITFHDGETLDADALVTFLDAIVSSPLSSQGFPERPTITKTGDLSVTLAFTEPWSEMPVVLAEQPGYVVAPDQLARGDSSHPIGTGPFVFDEWVRGSYLRAHRNPSYWREGLPYLDSIEFRPMSDPSTRETALTSGIADVIELGTPQRSLLDELAGEGNRVVDDVDNAGVTSVLMNTQRGATADQDVRRAIVAAIDREAYRDTVRDPSYELADQPYGEDSPWHTTVDYPAHDPALAEQLVVDHEGANGPIQLRILNVAGGPTTGVELIQAQLAAVGIDALIDNVDLARFIQQFVSGDFDIVHLGSFLSAADPDGSYPFLISSNADPASAIKLNFTGYRNAELDAALAAQRRTDDPAARQAQWATIWSILATDLPYAFLTHDRYAFVTHPDVFGLDGFSTAEGVALPAINHWTPFYTAVYRAPS